MCWRCGFDERGLRSQHAITAAVAKIGIPVLPMNFPRE
jgi:hypothetical protein